MDDKENIYKKVKSKIPLPKNPLPPLPEKFRVTRAPLRCLNNQADPTKNYENKKTVTSEFRQETKKTEERLDYLVFRDIALKYSDDDDDDEKDQEKENEVTQSDAVSSTQIDTVAKETPLENNRVRNIKKSLTRPHSRELQGLPPLARKKKVAEDGAKRRLNFVDPPVKLNCQTPEQSLPFTKRLDSDYTEDILDYLQSIEKKTPHRCEPTKLNRACVVNWLMKINGPHGDLAIMQAACWYLDQIQSIYHIPIVKLQLVATACYWIAQKLYQAGVPATRLVRCANHAFESSQLVYTEMMVLNMLKFPQQPVIPQDFTCYLARYCDDVNPGEIEQGATFLLSCGLLLNNVHDCPSVLAAAAVKNALLCLRRNDLIGKLETCPVYQRAVAKASDFQGLCSAQRIAVNTISHPQFEYRVPFEQFDTPPTYVAYKMVEEANSLANKSVY